MKEPDYTVEIDAGPPGLVGPLDEGHLHIRLALEPEPNQTWIEIFNNLPAGVEFWPDIEHPHAAGSGIDGQVRDDLLERYVAHIRERAAATNRNYNAEVAPQLKAAAEKQQAEFEKQEQRLADLQRRLEGL